MRKRKTKTKNEGKGVYIGGGRRRGREHIGYESLIVFNPYLSWIIQPLTKSQHVHSLTNLPQSLEAGTGGQGME